MTGLDKILKHIEDDASAAAEVVIKQAIIKADEITTAAKVEGEKLSAQILDKSKSDVMEWLSRGESAALLQEKKMILKAKQQIINETIDTAKSSLNSLSDKEYFDVVVRMIQKYALSQEGEIVFSSSDKARMPDDFGKSIASALSQKMNASLTISEQSRELNGGFVLLYGDIEENCSFDALFAAQKETLQDKVGALLFE